MPKRGKKYRNALEKVEVGRLYGPSDAMATVRETAVTNFDATVEVHMRLGVDPRQAEQMVRGSVVLPAGLGKTQRVLVFAQAEKAREAEQAGADFVGGAELAKKIEGGWLEFDVAIAAPDMMGVVGKLGRILGPRGLMPNNRTGTVTFEIARAVQEAKAGRVEFRVDKTSNLHVPIGKASFSAEDLLRNFAALYSTVMAAKPENSKGTYVRSISTCATMGPSVKIDPSQMQELLAAA